MRQASRHTLVEYARKRYARQLAESGGSQKEIAQAGQILAAVDLLKRIPHPNDVDIGKISNLCRCGTYPRIRKAIKRAAELMQEPKK